MAFKLFLAPRRDDQISHLRRQEAPQPAHALDFAYLVGDALFELLVQIGKLLRLHFQLSVLSRSSVSSRVFSMAITAWSANVVTSSICLSVNCLTSDVRAQRRRTFPLSLEEHRDAA